MRRSLCALLIASALGSGCFGSRATHFYTLSNVTDGGEVTGAPSGARLVVAVGPVSIPDYVDRPQIVVRESSNEVRLATFDQWAGSLQDMLARVLIEDVRARLPESRVIGFPSPGAPAFDYRVGVAVTRFDVSSAGEAVVAATWQVHDRSGVKTLLSRETTARAQAVGSRYHDRVAALSQAVGDLGDDIAGSLARIDGRSQ